MTPPPGSLLTVPADTTSTLPPPAREDRLATPTGSWVRWSDRRAVVRPLLAVALVVVAYRESLGTLLDALTLDSPLAHLAIVPLIALGMMVAAARRPGGPPIHDRQLDWILGLPLVAVSLAANLLLPGRMSTEFWVYRVDLLSLPLFVAGVITLLLGARALWRMRLGVLFLFLAWPVPYQMLLNRWLVPFTALTVHAVTAAVRYLPVATPSPGDNVNALFTVRHAADSFELSVASECSGANGLLGFVLVGFAMVQMMHGARRRKLAWLAVGAVLVWLLNVVRILIIFGAGRQWGKGVALDGFHPVIGLVVFNLGIVVMALVLRRFGLSFPGAARVPGRPLAPRARPYRPAVQAGAFVVLVATISVGLLNSNLRDYDLVASSLGTPRLTGFAPNASNPTGWKAYYSTQFDWSKRFFGAGSLWRRYIYSDKQGSENTLPGATGAPAPKTLAATGPVIADIITADDRAAFSTYGIEACYKFHNFQITKRQSVDLGNGVVGGLLTWRDPATGGRATTTLYWHWPVRSGGKTKWERVTLLVVDNPNLKFEFPAPQAGGLTKDFQLKLGGVLDGDADSALSQRLVDTRSFLVAFAQQVISLRTTRPA